MAGTTVLAAIDESGALAWRMTDDELAQSPDQLDAWIALHHLAPTTIDARRGPDRTGAAGMTGPRTPHALRPRGGLGAAAVALSVVLSAGCSGPQPEDPFTTGPPTP